MTLGWNVGDPVRASPAMPECSCRLGDMGSVSPGFQRVFFWGGGGRSIEL